MIVANLVIQLLQGPEVRAATRSEGDTLEWSTSSPPPAYNYAVIPTVTSPYPMWDSEDRELDSRRLERGEGVLPLGHETPAPPPCEDAEWDEILSMPSHSIWPFLSAR